MRYYGGKALFSKPLCGFLNSVIEHEQNFYDLFCGACNVVTKIEAKHRYANDLRQFMVSTMESARDGYEFPSVVTREDHKNAFSLPETDPLHGFILVGCSYGGVYKGGYSENNDRNNWATQAKNSTENKGKLLKDVIFTNLDYQDVVIRENSVIYCDIPYFGAAKYRGIDFDFDRFYTWVSKQKNPVYISEYKGSYNPLNLPTVWELEIKKNIKTERPKVTEIIRKFTPAPRIPSDRAKRFIQYV